MKNETWDELMLGADCYGPVIESDIKEAESRLGIEFPGTYRDFISKYGAALADSFEIAGVTPSDGSNRLMIWQEVVDLNLAMQRTLAGSKPLDNLVISSNGLGVEYMLILVSQAYDGSCDIVAQGPGVDGIKTARTMFDFIRLAKSGKLPE